MAIEVLIVENPILKSIIDATFASTRHYSLETILSVNRTLGIRNHDFGNLDFFS